MTRYDERMVAPPLWWGAALALSFVLAAGIHGGSDGGRAVVPYVVLPLLTALVLARLSRGRVRVAEAVLHVPGARIPVRAVGAVTPLDRAATRQVRGPLADPLAYVVTRPWLPQAVRVSVEDPEDDTPYWLVGTRDPQALAQAITSSREPG